MVHIAVHRAQSPGQPIQPGTPMVCLAKSTLGLGLGPSACSLDCFGSPWQIVLCNVQRLLASGWVFQFWLGVAAWVAIHDSYRGCPNDFIRLEIGTIIDHAFFAADVTLKFVCSLSDTITQHNTQSVSSKDDLENKARKQKRNWTQRTKNKSLKL